MGLLRWISGIIVCFWIMGFILRFDGGMLHILLVAAVILFVVDMIIGRKLT